MQQWEQGEAKPIERERPPTSKRNEGAQVQVAVPLIAGPDTQSRNCGGPTPLPVKAEWDSSTRVEVAVLEWNVLCWRSVPVRSRERHVNRLEEHLLSVLITGANRGLGLEFGRQYEADGWRVFATCRQPNSAADLQNLAKAGTLKIFRLDVTDRTTIKEAARQIQEPIDVLINSAGIAGPSDQRTGKVDYEAWRKVLDVNTMGPLRVTEAFIPHLARSARKLVVTITSGMGSIGDNGSGGSIPYRSSKAAVNMVVRTVAIDLADRGIVSVVISPGWVKTDMGGPNAPLTASESVGAIRRLVSTLGPALSGRFFNHNGREYPW
jgi:NAD(P)-dependent dehydrogenase (short-subunit alcohol dehydrogenase family)